MSMIRATTPRLVAMRLFNPSHVCAGVANSSLLQHGIAACGRGIRTKKEIGEGLDTEKTRPGERSQVLEGGSTSPRLVPRASALVCL